MLTDVALPLVLLGLAAWVVPWLLSKLLPEGVGWLFVIALLSACLLALIAAGGFYVLYGDAGDVILSAAPWHFLLLSTKAALIWAPVMILSVANLPRGWKEAVW
ncbi:hypothetical protein [Jannaschia pohangensis]|uniref:NADH-quinone oxidoreductase subunit M n=1 Tax=Jannaschia pohangensis TaxID=390807 RepID=A0A1I3MLA5_9RHOB|nr:hypothetical protein [Jannaschia pohangensis]SFI97894.1 hypothetical protein SAMN04488095_1890 [Jannaschia pohangensis]